MMLLRGIRKRGGFAAAISYDGTLSSLGLTTGNALTIPAGQNWLNDLSTCPALGWITLDGNLYDDTSKNVQLNGKGIWIKSTGGYFEGTASVRNASRVDRILSAAVPTGRILGPTHTTSNVARGNPNDATGVPTAGAARGIIIEDGGRCDLWSAAPAITNTTLAASVAAGATSFTVAGQCYWKAGDLVSLGMSNFLQSLSQADSTVVYTLASDTVPGASTTVCNIVGTVTYARYGVLQYGTGAGMSLTNDGYTASNLNGHVPAYMDATARGTYAAEITAAIAAGRKNVLDQRAPVSLLSRRSTISAPNDTAFSGDERFGVHIMKMGLSGSLILSGVEIFNCGQGGALGRYPVHFHMNSYNSGTGAYLGSLSSTNALIEKCAIRASKNRGITFHGCRGAVARNNSVHDVLGHALFQEDGSEKDNTWDGNYVSKWRDPGNTATTPAPSGSGFDGGYRLKKHDAMPAGLWCTNINNTIQNNRVSDGHVGLWINQDASCRGLSSLVSVQPVYEQVLLWDNNTAHSCYQHGSRAAFGTIDEFGNFGNTGAVESRSNNLLSGTLVASLFTNETLWKNNGSGFTDTDGNRGMASGNYQNIVSKPNYVGWVVADCLGQDFFGNTNASPDLQFSEKNLFVGISLNSESIQTTTVLTRNAFASYHGSIPFRENTFINYLPTTPKFDLVSDANYRVLANDSVLSTWDLYINPLESMGVANTNNHYIDALPVWKSPGPGAIRNTSIYSAYQSAAQIPSGVGDGWNSMALVDYDGRLGGLGRTKAFMVLDHPFVTTGISDLYTPDDKGFSSFQKITQTPVYGFEVWRMAGLYGGTYPSSGTNPNPYRGSGNNADDRYAGAIKYFRADPTTLADIGSTAVADFGYARTNLGGQMAAVPRGGAVRVSTAAYNETGTSGAATLFAVTLYGFMRTTAGGWSADDWMLIGIDWPGGTAPGEVYLKLNTARDPQGYAPETLDPVASKAALLALTGYNKAGMGYWRDTANNMLWARVAYNVAYFGTPTDTAANWVVSEARANILTFGVSP